MAVEINARRSSRATKGARTREQIVDIIVGLVNERGVESIRIADICKPAGLAVGAFYFHFTSKDDALDQIATATVDTVFGGALAVPRSSDLLSEMIGILSEFYRAALERRYEIKAFFHIMNARRHPRVRRAWLDRRSALVARVRDRIEEERQVGHVPAFASATVAAHFLIGALERFYDDVFFLTIDDELPAAAGNFDVFVREQAVAWVRIMTGANHP